MGQLHDGTPVKWVMSSLDLMDTWPFGDGDPFLMILCNVPSFMSNFIIVVPPRKGVRLTAENGDPPFFCFDSRVSYIHK